MSVIQCENFNCLVVDLTALLCVTIYKSIRLWPKQGKMLPKPYADSMIIIRCGQITCYDCASKGNSFRPAMVMGWSHTEPWPHGEKAKYIWFHDYCWINCVYILKHRNVHREAECWMLLFCGLCSCSCMHQPQLPVGLNVSFRRFSELERKAQCTCVLCVFFCWCCWRRRVDSKLSKQFSAVLQTKMTLVALPIILPRFVNICIVNWVESGLRWVQWSCWARRSVHRKIAFYGGIIQF